MSPEDQRQHPPATLVGTTACLSRAILLSGKQGRTTVADFSHLQAHQFFGEGVDNLFPHGAPITSTPWAGMSRQKKVKDYDPGVVREALSAPPVLSEVDPRDLRSTQPMVTREGVEYYSGDTYAQTGRTFAEQGNVGNRHPFIYRREDGQNLILAGHHRAAAALVQGRPLRAQVVEGPWGPLRRPDLQQR